MKEKCENCTYYGRPGDVPETVEKSCMYHWLMDIMDDYEPLPCKPYED